MKLNFSTTYKFICSMLLLIHAGFLASCADYFEPRNVTVSFPEQDDMLVINGILNPDSVFQISVSRSTGILKKEQNPFIANAQVELFESGQPVAVLTHTANGRYRGANIKPRAGQTYSIRATAGDFGAVQATATIPVAVTIDSVKVERKTNNFEGEVEITIGFSDPAGKENFYHLLLLAYENNNGRIGGVFQTHFSTRDVVLKDGDDFGTEETNHWGEGWFDDTLIDGDNYSLKINAFDYMGEIARFKVILLSTTEAYFRYFSSISSQQETDENPFAEPVQVFTNIQGGLGIFTGFSSSSAIIDLIPGLENP